MIQVTLQMRVLVAVEAVDFRNGIDGLARLCRERLNADAFSGCLFVFRNRTGTAVKILVYDGQGFWLCQKRLSSGRFRWWPTAAQGAAPPLESFQLQMLLAGVNPYTAQGAAVWRRVSPPS